MKGKNVAEKNMTESIWYIIFNKDLNRDDAVLNQALFEIHLLT